MRKGSPTSSSRAASITKMESSLRCGSSLRLSCVFKFTQRGLDFDEGDGVDITTVEDRTDGIKVLTRVGLAMAFRRALDVVRSGEVQVVVWPVGRLFYRK